MNRENLLFVDTNIGQLGYQPQRERVFHDRLRQEVQRMPGVRAAATASITPQSGSRWNNWVQIEGYKWKPDEPPHVDMNAVTPRFFESAGIPIVLGRIFEIRMLWPASGSAGPAASSGHGSPGTPGPPRVAIVNEALVRKFLAGRSPIGMRLSMGEKWRVGPHTRDRGRRTRCALLRLRKAVEPMILSVRLPRTGRKRIRADRAHDSDDPNRLIAAIRGVHEK